MIRSTVALLIALAASPALATDTTPELDQGCMAVRQIADLAMFAHQRGLNMGERSIASKTDPDLIRVYDQLTLFPTYPDDPVEAAAVVELFANEQYHQCVSLKAKFK
jgi:hypothetical protein